MTILRRTMTTFAASRLVRLTVAASLCGVICAVTMLGARPARAQASDPETRPTRGPFITNAARAGDADATAVELNPGAIGLLPGGSLELIATAGTSSSAPDARTRRGGGFYWAA